MTEFYNTDINPQDKRRACTFYCCGSVEGNYKDSEQNISLSGFGAIEQSRWISKIIRHSSFDIELLLPPEGIGFSIRTISHVFGLETFFKIQLWRKFEYISYIKSSP
jgi:hypothetical protein